MYALLLSHALLFGGQHDQKPQEAMHEVEFMVGKWKGSQTFMVPGDATPMVGEASDSAEFAVGGRFIEERLSTTLPGRSPTDTRHMLAYDPVNKTYRAYWFNDTSPLPMELSGKLDGQKLALYNTPSSPQAPHLRFTYDGSRAGHLTLTFEMQRGEAWTLLFRSEYTK